MNRLADIEFTSREQSVIPLLLRGLTAKEIGRLLVIFYQTIEEHLDVLKKKLHERNKAELILKLLASLEFMIKIGNDENPVFLRGENCLSTW